MINCFRSCLAHFKQSLALFRLSLSFVVELTSLIVFVYSVFNVLFRFIPSGALSQSFHLLFAIFIFLRFGLTYVIVITSFLTQKVYPFGPSIVRPEVSSPDILYTTKSIFFVNIFFLSVTFRYSGYLVNVLSLYSGLLAQNTFSLRTFNSAFHHYKMKKIKNQVLILGIYIQVYTNLISTEEQLDKFFETGDYEELM